MQNLEPSGPLAPSSVFQLWITQWRLGILDTRESALVLRMVLRDLRTKSADDPFWKYLRQFLVPSDASPGTSHSKEGVEAEQLLHCALTLQPQQAKSLLEYLGECYAFNGDGLQFWKSVREGIDVHAAVPREPVRSDAC